MLKVYSFPICHRSPYSNGHLYQRHRRSSLAWSLFKHSYEQGAKELRSLVSTLSSRLRQEEMGIIDCAGKDWINHPIE